MISVCVEIETDCKKCGSPLLLNALSDKVQCPSCMEYANFPYEFWKNNILDSPLNEFSDINENEGKSQTMMTGEYTIRMKYGRQQARCGKCKTNIDVSKINDYSKTGFAPCTNCSAIISVRKLPPDLSELFDTVKYLAGEDSDLIPEEKNIRPLLFTCPSCAGNLEIDGKDRVINCKFCGSEIYLPDDLWLKFHPVKTISRWYLLLDEESVQKKMPIWEHLADITIDSSGNVYFLGEYDTGQMMVWSMGRDFKTGWLTKIGNYDYMSTGFVISGSALLIYDRNKHNLLKLSCKDGSKADNLFDKRIDCDDAAVDSDGNLLCLCNDKIIRYSADGKLLPVWNEAEESRGIFSSILKLFHTKSDDDPVPDVYELKDKPERIDSSDCFVAIGLDGFTYFMSKSGSDEDTIIKYNRCGEKLWSSAIPMGYKYSKPHIDPKGNIFILGDVENKDGENKRNLIKFNTGNNKWETVLKNITEGGTLNDEEFLVISNDGLIYIADGYNCLKVFDAGLKRIFITEQSSEDDEDAISDYKEETGDDDSTL